MEILTDGSTEKSAVAPSAALLRYRRIVIAALAVILAWGVLTRSLTAYLAGFSPETATWLRPDYSPALTNLAVSRYREAQRGAIQPIHDNGSRSDREPTSPAISATDSTLKGAPAETGEPQLDPEASAQIRAWAERAISSDPLNARAFAVLARLSQYEKDDKRTQRLMQATVRRSLLEIRAVDFMMRASYLKKDYPAALRYADALLRVDLDSPDSAMEVLGRISEISGINNELKSVLANNPPWRSLFFRSLPQHISDARTPLDLFLSLKETAHPPNNQDLREYINFLISRGFQDLAYYAWLQFLPPEQLGKVGHLYNGSFEFPLSELPFDWTFHAGTGVTVEIAPRPDISDEQALFMEFGPARVENFSVTEALLLAPGQYRFQGKYKLDLVSERGLVWQVLCTGEPIKSLGASESFNAGETGWKDFEFAFTVPEAGCLGQSLELTLNARSASEQFASGSAWFDDLRIIRDAIVQEQQSGSALR
jgi:hypothetical protein